MPAVIGVLGAGTMGAGIAQLAARAGARTLLHDPVAEALETRRAEDRGRPGQRSRERAPDGGRGRAAVARLEPAAELAQLAPCELVIEAAPERLELKHELYRALSEIVGEQLRAGEQHLLAAGDRDRARGDASRARGGHALLQPGAGHAPAGGGRRRAVLTGSALAIADATGRAMGKTVIRASDGPGFLVNRSNRPFGLEALRLLQERIADVATIDRICRMQGGFPHGPVRADGPGRGRRGL